MTYCVHCVNPATCIQCLRESHARQARTQLTKMSRRTDPESSKVAAEKLVQSGALKGQHAQALELVRQHPGKTSRELAAGDPDLRYMLARRLAELADPDRWGGVAYVRRVEQPGGIRWWLTRET